MFRIDDPSAAVALPTPEAANVEGYWTEGNPVTSTLATLERASWFNMIQEELRAIVVAGGLTPSKVTYNQVLTAINNLIEAANVSFNYAADTGAANAYAVALTPAITVAVAGMMVKFKAAHANTGASTLAVNGLSPVSLVSPAGAALVAGNIAAGQIVEAVFDGTYYQIINAKRDMKTAAVVLAADISTTSATFVSCTGLSITLAVGASGIAIIAAGMNQKPAGAGGASGSLRINQDNTSYQSMGRTGEVDVQASASGLFIFTGLTAGNHVFTLEWKRITSTTTAVQCRPSTYPDNDAAYISGFSI